MAYGCETIPLPADVGLKFEKAEMQMIRYTSPILSGGAILINYSIMVLLTVSDCH